MGTRRSKPKTNKEVELAPSKLDEMALEEIEDICRIIEGNIVWTRRLDKPYQVWQYQARLFQGVLLGDAEQAIKDASEYVERSLKLPKARRDKEFKTLLRLLRVTIRICQKM